MQVHHRIFAALSAAALTAGLIGVMPARAQAQTLPIGVIGDFDGQTALGVSLAIERLKATGVTGPNGVSYEPTIVAVEGRTQDEVTNAITSLKSLGVVAIFGPEDDLVATASQAALSGAGVPVFTPVTSSAFAASNLVLRTRADDKQRMAALAEVLVQDLGKTKVAIYQGSEAYVSPVTDFKQALTDRGVTASTTIIQTPSGTVDESITQIVGAQPDSVAAFGEPVAIAAFFRALRTSGYAGAFFSDVVESPLFINDIPPTLRSEIYGVTGWSYITGEADALEFTRDYTTLFGQVPGAYSAASYDAAVALLIAVQRVGLDADSIKDTILSFPATDSIQGSFDPTLGNNTLNADVAVINLSIYGGQNVLVAFRNGTRFDLPTLDPLEDNAANPAATSAAIAPTATLASTVSVSGPNAVVATVTRTQINVRSGPGIQYEVIAKLNQDAQFEVTGISPDFAWLATQINGRIGWVSGDLVTVSGNLQTLPVVQPPPTPTALPATATPTLAPIADITYVTATLNPPIPAPGQPFTLTVTVRNNGSVASGDFAIATSFLPGDVFNAATVTSLAPGAQTNVNLTASVTGTGYQTIAIVLDLNNQIAEGDVGEANNKPTFTYKVDLPTTVTSVTLSAGQTVDFDGGGTDFSYTGTALQPDGNAALVQLSAPPDQVHNGLVAQQLSGVANGTNVVNNPPGNTAIAMRGTAGKLAYLVVTGYPSGQLQATYYLYP